METVSLEQSQEVMAKAGTNCRWHEISSHQAQQAYENPARLGVEFTRFIQNGGRVAVTLTNGILPPPGGRIQPLTVVVDESRPWDQVVKEAAPNTTKDSHIWRAGDQYPPSIGAEPMIKQVILANFGENNVENEHVLDWGIGQRLIPATQRCMFAVPKHYTDLDKHLGINPMALVTLDPCSRGCLMRVPFVWWDVAERTSNFYGYVSKWNRGHWFVFVSE